MTSKMPTRLGSEQLLLPEPPQNGVGVNTTTAPIEIKHILEYTDRNTNSEEEN